MTLLQKALARLKELVGELDTLEKKDLLTADDLKAITEKQTEIEAKEGEIEALKKSEAIRARAAAPAGAVLAAAPAIAERTGEPDQATVPAAPERKMEPQQQFSLLAAASYKAKGRDGGKSVPVLKILADNGYAKFAQEIEAAIRRDAPAGSVNTSTIDALIPTTLSSQIIDLLRPETTFFQGNPLRVEFTNGQFKAPRGASGATASYVGEGAKKPVTGPTFDSISMTPKKLAGIVLITKEARQWSLPNLEAYIRADLQAAMAQATDLNAYFGTGAGDSPTGILKADIVTKFNAADYAVAPLAPTITEIDNIASRLVLHLTLSNISQSSSWKWLMNYRTLEYLKNLRVGDDTGVYAYPELRNERPTWKGFGVLVTNQVPINGGATTDESLLALIDFRHVLYAEAEGIVVRTSEEATIDVNGTLVHLFQQNMDAILTETQHDFGLRHANAVAVMEHVRWGAQSYTGSP